MGKRLLVSKMLSGFARKAAVVSGSAIVGGAVLTSTTKASDDALHAPKYGFEFQKPLSSFDYASIRRGYQVYREVCSTCHSLERIAWRNLVGVSHTVDEVKAMAQDVEYEDGPNDNGEMFQRPGKLA